MKVPLDAEGVAALAARFGEFHDSVIRRFGCTYGEKGACEIELEAMDLEGAWHRVTMVVQHVSEFRLTEGPAVWGNAPTWDVTVHHADGTSTEESRPRDYSDLGLGGATNQVIYAAAIHATPRGPFVDLAPASHEPSKDLDPVSWRKSTFYVFGRSGYASVEPVEQAPIQPQTPAIRELLRGGAITLYHRATLFDAAIAELTVAGARVHAIDASSAATVQAALTEVLRFDENFGYAPWTGNLDALVDAFREVDYRAANGVVLAFRHFDAWVAESSSFATGVLDVLEMASRDALLDGHALLGLVQTDAPHLQIAPLGGRAPSWNRAEWLNASRSG